MDDSNILLKKNNEPEEAKIEIGGSKSLEPTRYGKDTPEWEVRGRVSDF